MNSIIDMFMRGEEVEAPPEDKRSDLHIYLERRFLINAPEPSKRKYEGGCWGRTGLPDTDNVGHNMPPIPTMSIIMCPYSDGMKEDRRCRAPRSIHGAGICDGQCKYNALHSLFEMPDGSDPVLPPECIYKVILTNGTEGCCGPRTSIFCTKDCDMYKSAATSTQESILSGAITLDSGRIVQPQCRFYRVREFATIDHACICLDHAGSSCDVTNGCSSFVRDQHNSDIELRLR